MEVIKTAGLQGALAAAAVKVPAQDPRREAIRAARAVLRKADATDDEWDDALEALVELAKD